MLEVVAIYWGLELDMKIEIRDDRGGPYFRGAGRGGARTKFCGAGRGRGENPRGGAGRGKKARKSTGLLQKW